MRRIIYQHTEIQIVFKSDADLKEQALLKAKLEGITLKAMLTMAMRAYVNDEFEIMFGKRGDKGRMSRYTPFALRAPPLGRGGGKAK